MSRIDEMPENILFPPDVVRRYGLSLKTLERMRTTGGGPAFVRLGTRRIAYLESELDAWLASRSFPNRAAEMARRPGA